MRSCTVSPTISRCMKESWSASTAGDPAWLAWGRCRHRGVGQVGRGAQDPSDVTRSALWHGLAHARPGGRLTDIGAAVERTVRGAVHDYGIVREYVGHGSAPRCTCRRTPNVGPAGKVRGWSPVWWSQWNRWSPWVRPTT